MNIGFKNFRKFENFPNIEIAPITMLVGGNNAGKSTVVKALLAVKDFLDYRGSGVEEEDDEDFYEDENADSLKKEQKRKNARVKFYFNSSYLAHIGTFKRALYNKAKENTIVFSYSDNYYNYEISVEGNPSDKDAISGDVVKFDILDKRYNIEYHFNQKEKTINTIYHPIKKEDINFVRDHEYAALITHDIEIKVPLELSRYYSTRSFISAYCNILYENGIINDRITNRVTETKNNKECSIPGLSKEDISNLEKIYSAYPGLTRSRINISDIEYIYAHAVTQSIIYSAKDTNDYLVKTVHEFANLRLKKNSKEVKFITNWMKEFNIGKNFKIESVGGEAHIVKITNFDDEEVNLADKGMGSIQLMILLFRITTIITYKSSLLNADLVIVEEPEQNLHPSLQSKLADFFLYCYKEFGVKFLIETHSEYLVRKTQLLVAQKSYEKNDRDYRKITNNPFKVYYFPNEGEPYDMCYMENGKFERSFEKGFFDEASELHLQMLYLQRR